MFVCFTALLKYFLVLSSFLNINGGLFPSSRNTLVDGNRKKSNGINMDVNGRTTYIVNIDYLNLQIVFRGLYEGRNRDGDVMTYFEYSCISSRRTRSRFERTFQCGLNFIQPKYSRFPILG